MSPADTLRLELAAIAENPATRWLPEPLREELRRVAREALAGAAPTREPLDRAALGLEALPGWLYRGAEWHLAGNDPLGTLTALGLLARLRPPPATPDERRRLVVALLEGQAVPELNHERELAKALPVAELTHAEDLAAAKAGRLREDLEMLVGNPRPGCADWRADVAYVAEERDDLEGVRLLLREAGRGERLVRALDPLDLLGEVARLTLPALEAQAGDWRDRLEAARGATPEGWWLALFDAPPSREATVRGLLARLDPEALAALARRAEAAAVEARARLGAGSVGAVRAPA